MEDTGERNFYTVAECAKNFGVNENTIRRYINNKELKAEKNEGRFYIKVADVQDFQRKAFVVKLVKSRRAAR